MSVGSLARDTHLLLALMDVRDIYFNFSVRNLHTLDRSFATSNLARGRSQIATRLF